MWPVCVINTSKRKKLFVKGHDKTKRRPLTGWCVSRFDFDWKGELSRFSCWNGSVYHYTWRHTLRKGTVTRKTWKVFVKVYIKFSFTLHFPTLDSNTKSVCVENKKGLNSWFNPFTLVQLLWYVKHTPLTLLCKNGFISFSKSLKVGYSYCY